MSHTFWGEMRQKEVAKVNQALCGQFIQGVNMYNRYPCIKYNIIPHLHNLFLLKKFNVTSPGH